jgi:hypothetical protein
LIPGLEHVEEDWRKPIANYLRDPSQKVDKGIQRIAFKFNLVNDELYYCTTENLFVEVFES